MLWRHLCLVRAGSAAGLIGGMIWLGGSAATAQVAVPESATAPSVARPEPSAPPADLATGTVDLLAASRSGDLSVTGKGQGQDKVRLVLRNNVKRRLNVVIPPGLVASSKVGQGRAGGGGAGGMQSIGLGAVGNGPGAFGEFQPGAGGLRSIPAAGTLPSRTVAVPAGEMVELTVPGVCLNYGLPAPTPRDTLAIMDVETYTEDLRVRKALRSLATMGTSHGVAQAVMWNVCNNIAFEAMMEKAGKLINLPEIALAARFVQALDESTSAESIDPSALIASRVILQIEGQGDLDRDARRIAAELDGLRVLGLPVKVAQGEIVPPCLAPAMAVRVVLNTSKPGETRGRIIVRTCSIGETWTPIGSLAFRENSTSSVIDGPTMARALDRAISGAFVTVRPAHRSVGSTTLKIENRLPFTISAAVVKTGHSAGDPSVPFEAVGVGPARSVLLPIQAATANVVEHVQLNGL